MHSKSGFSRCTRRVLFAAAASLLAGAVTLGTGVARAQEPLKIGIIGTGKIGGALARHWVMAGHEVFVSSRHPEELAGLVKELGPKAHAGTPREAAAFGSVVLVSVPYGAMPQIGTDFAKELAGKVIIDTSNPVERRDGPQAAEWQRKGAGVATAELLMSKRVVRAFNCIPAVSLANEANRRPARIGIPIGGDDAAALAIAERLVRDAGFDPVVVGSLAKTREFDLGQPLAQGNLSAAELRARMTK
ncbi:MAG TPA: NAD(P)-binding domain-containing protein [Gammaproteobacteria bacterium]|jgi:predicted dinucleotide-binding enzyme|nr:NAD(P)-binding domain-containing protein [Gammaproteobacteria bacterium]